MNVRPIQEIKLGEWVVVTMFNGRTDYECFIYKDNLHSYIDEDGMPGSLNALMWDNWIVVDWFEDVPDSSCTCPIASLMGNGCTCGAIVRYTK